MSKHECRSTNVEARKTKGKRDARVADLNIGHSSFLRHSCLGSRHSAHFSGAAAATLASAAGAGAGAAFFELWYICVSRSSAKLLVAWVIFVRRFLKNE